MSALPVEGADYRLTGWTTPDATAPVAVVPLPVPVVRPCLLCSCPPTFRLDDGQSVAMACDDHLTALIRGSDAAAITVVRVS